MNEACQHINSIKEIKIAGAYLCAECVKTGGDWVHLRICQTCGITLCCDDSPARHMTAHYHKTGHPVITSAEPGQKWFWCYADDAFAEDD